MMRRLCKLALLLLILACTPPMVHAQDAASSNTSAPTAAQWKEWQNEKDINYRDDREYDAEAIKKEKQRREEMERSMERTSKAVDVFASIFRFFSSLAGKVILGAILLALVGFILYKILSQGGLFSRRASGVPEPESLPSEDEELSASDWDRKMKAAIDAGDLRLAVRCGYMRLLQLLQDRNHLQYRQDKTNVQYLRELQDASLKDTFRQMSRQYEWAWYGKYEPTSEGFAQYLQTLNSAKAKLNSL